MNYEPANKGLLGVLSPRALLAMTPCTGVPSGALALRGLEGVSTGEFRKSGIGGGASGTDCSTTWVSFSIWTSSRSEEGKSSGGGEDMTRELWMVQYGRAKCVKRVATRQFQV